jgi:hypothetical protein
MEIQGPVDYWTAKYKEHKKAARVWGAILVGYAVAGCVAIAFILHFATRMRWRPPNRSTVTSP